MSVPTKKPFFISQQNKLQLEKILAVRTKHPVNILVKGNHGMGKSELARQVAAAHNMDYVPVPIGSLQETGQLMGRYELVNGETKFVEGKFPKAVKTPNTLIHLEELNRPESPKALNDLFPLLDDGRALVHEQLGEIKVANGVVFVATLNEGFEYTGIDPLDAALEDRFHIIRLGYLPVQMESTLILTRTGLNGDKTTKLLQFVNKLRMDGQEPIHVSTRRCIMIAELVMMGLDLQQAIVANVALDMDKLESVLLQADFSGQSVGAVSGTGGNGTDKNQWVVL
uniref:Putative ATPase domain containing protein n=1 Tax=viral metagenome TaxID=1070528 RepID=A0A6M3KPS3_9ZZZZ